MQLAIDYQWKPERREPRQPTSRNGIALLAALKAGHRLTVLTAPQVCQVCALSQEVGRLKGLDWSIRSGWKDLGSSKRVMEYWL